MMSEMAKRYLVAYDISDDHRRSQVSNLLQKYGDRVQFSVFILDIKPARFIRLKTNLTGIIDLDDSVLICDLGPLASISTSQFSFLGTQRKMDSAAGWLIT